MFGYIYLSSIDSNFNTCSLEEEWDRLEKIANILEPFYDITVLFLGTNNNCCKFPHWGSRTVQPRHLRLLPVLCREN